MLFLERCNQADIPECDRHRDFSIILIGHARQYYFDVLKRQHMTLGELEYTIKSRFKTQERTSDPSSRENQQRSILYSCMAETSINGESFSHAHVNEDESLLLTPLVLKIPHFHTLLLLSFPSKDAKKISKVYGGHRCTWRKELR